MAARRFFKTLPFLPVTRGYHRWLKPLQSIVCREPALADVAGQCHPANLPAIGAILMLELEVEPWSVVDAAELYEVARWGNGYFSVNDAGHVSVHPTKERGRSIDLKQLVDRLQLRGIDLPILIRFAEILKHRLGEIHGAFQSAIADHKYQGNYCCVYPIKVNQQRQVVEEVLQFGRPFKFGMEAGSKPELLAVVAMAGNDTPII